MLGGIDMGQVLQWRWWWQWFPENVDLDVQWSLTWACRKQLSMWVGQRSEIEIYDTDERERERERERESE